MLRLCLLRYAPDCVMKLAFDLTVVTAVMLRAEKLGYWNQQRYEPRITGAIGGALVVLGLLAAPVWAAGYSAVELGTLAQGGNVVLGGMNDAGQIVGSGIITDGQRAFVLSRGHLQNILTNIQSDYSVARGINGGGVVVGSLNLSQGLRGFRWTTTNGIVELAPLPGDTANDAFAINASGEAVGLSAGPAGTRAVRWSSPGVPQPLDALPGARNSSALAINQAGITVGVSGNHAVAWSGTGSTALGALRDGDPSEALSINASGHIVGSSGDPVARRAVLWGPGSAPRDLGEQQARDERDDEHAGYRRDNGRGGGPKTFTARSRDERMARAPTDHGTGSKRNTRTGCS
jgi:uncharacterized membrane protein